MPETVELDQPKPVYVFEELYNLVDQCIDSGHPEPARERDEVQEEIDLLAIKILISNMKAKCPEDIWRQLTTITAVRDLSLKEWTPEVARDYLPGILEDLERPVGMVSWKEDFGGWEVYEAFLGGNERSMALAYDARTAEIVVKALVK